MKNIAILGSTGSVGSKTLQVVDQYPDEFNIVALACGTNCKLLEKQIRKYRPAMACIYAEEDAKQLRESLSDLPSAYRKNLQIMSGMEGLTAMAALPESDMLVTAIVGMIGIRPTIEAIRAGKDVALANKETLVTAGHLIMPLAAEKGCRIFPVDSEQSAIAQCLKGEDKQHIDRILLTASGGPFFGKTREELKNVTPADALKHPNWEMGRKITIDSATLVNKGLEIIEASWLFGIPEDRITVVVQPQSIIHSMVQFSDGAVAAQLWFPDMKLSIQYALFGNHRRFLKQPRIDFAALRSISFAEPDSKTFRGIELARTAMKEGGLMPTAMNAANEKAVALFLEGKIGFLTIYDLIEDCMQDVENIQNPELEQILAAEEAAYRRIQKRMDQ